MDKRICFILPGWVTKHTGGAELQCYLLSEEFIKRGWKVEVLTAVGKIENSNYLNKSIKYYYLVDKKFALLKFIQTILFLFRTDSRYYYIRTDARAMRGALTFFAKLAKKKTIYGLACDDDAKNISYLSNYLRKKKRMFIKIFRCVDYGVVDWFSKKSILKLDKIIAQTDQQQILLKKYTGLESLIISNSFKFENYRVKKENLIIWVANLRALKRPEIFINLAKKFENSGWKFVMIGKYDKKFKNIIDEAKRIKNFKFFGSLSYVETNQWFAKSEILVNTSTVEGFSNTFLQAWFYEVALVSLAVNPNNILTKGNTGYYANDNMLELENIIRNLMDDYFEFSKNQIINGKKYLMNNFDLDKNVDKLIDVIKEL